MICFYKHVLEGLFLCRFLSRYGCCNYVFIFHCCHGKSKKLRMITEEEELIKQKTEFRFTDRECHFRRKQGGGGGSQQLSLVPFLVEL